ncbi:Uncharacterised protein [Mycobacterium tuberculosis]|uniref:Uncharacterized protein n=1 Tax=Mycobacterium tuberculosis TaxID=1773 RepID=A0A916LBT2_MYCTX|nr:Uncharacterised protein [Mycobacterium tuberculosis]COX32440.1 Uncharacterised protein [Mycobacterium tuberculosis]COY23456.1 Uncharacterised protein [Mycobacterium tuberculosis]COY28355.1 Uncharacterised protein [Mycobacterium tuberculosis]
MPAPVTTTACTSGSPSARWIAARNCADISSVTAFRRSGSLTVMSATCLSTLSKTGSYWAIGHLRGLSLKATLGVDP